MTYTIYMEEKTNYGTVKRVCLLRKAKGVTPLMALNSRAICFSLDQPNAYAICDTVMSQNGDKKAKYGVLINGTNLYFVALLMLNEVR